MENRIYDRRNGLWYERQGDYYLPCLSKDASDALPIGMWGERRKRFLHENRKGVYTGLWLAGKLDSHLSEIDAQAEKMFTQLVSKLAAQEGVTEKLKAQNQLLWVQRMNNIQNRATEIVNAELIYS